MNRYAILGHPVSHSSSPEFHNAVFQGLALEDHRYEFCDTAPDELEQLMQSFRAGEYQGFSVTIPHKQAVMDYCDELSERARKVGAVNTLILKGPREKGQGPKGTIVGDNTDYLGFEKSLEEKDLKDFNDPKDLKEGKVLVLGAGGAAKAVVAVLLDHGYEVVVASRRKDPKDHKDLKDLKAVTILQYDQLDSEDGWGMIVNTTPVGMQGDKVQGSRVKGQVLLLEDSRWYNPDRTYVDIVYTPKMTPFLERAEQVGGKIVTGDRMFFWQAVEQAKMFTEKSEEEVLGVLGELI